MLMSQAPTAAALVIRSQISRYDARAATGEKRGQSFGSDCEAEPAFSWLETASLPQALGHIRVFPYLSMEPRGDLQAVRPIEEPRGGKVALLANPPLRPDPRRLTNHFGWVFGIVS